MAKPILYGPSYSTFTRSVRIALQEKGVDYDLVEVDILACVPQEQVARHPFAKVPAFEHDGFGLYETAAIERYVDEAFDGPDLQPGTPRSRARMQQIMSIVDAYLYPPAVGQIVIQRLVVPMQGGEPDEAAIDAALPAVRTGFEALEALNAGQDYLAGSEVSLADCHLVPVYDYFRMTPESGAVLGAAPGLSQWWDRMSARESVVQTTPQLA